MNIREIQSAEFDLVWPLFQQVISTGDTYAYDPAMSFNEAQAMWTTPPARVFVAVDGADVIGCYVLKPNQPGRGDHVANAGYMVAPQARGRGVAGVLCEHSMRMARQSGFIAMQFNYVVSSNEVAVRLWQKHGFEIIGRVPKAFRHAQLGLTDVYVMHRTL
ncbi:MAG: histone acetyltransferase and related acetyltransferase [Herminiimonas sp.]|jgi:ribosomal protein S18 acetylase RimI-like enzyme|nr:histone acetyltransferase and related acetyltransferase [Herminiimonas sp.]